MIVKVEAGPYSTVLEFPTGTSKASRQRVINRWFFSVSGWNHRISDWPYGITPSIISLKKIKLSAKTRFK
jgi:hypothetical protein